MEREEGRASVEKRGGQPPAVSGVEPVTDAGQESAATVDVRAWYQNSLDYLDRKIPSGAPAKLFVYGVLTLGAVAALRSKDKRPIITAVQGLVGATLANTTSSVVNHRVTPHGSTVLGNESAVTAARFAQAALVGGHTDWTSAMHEVHHDNVDGPGDPHSPTDQGRWKIFFGLNNITKKFARQHPELIAAEQNDSRTRRRSFDNKAVTALGIVGTHILMGEKFDQPLKDRAVSAAIHALGIFIFYGTFSADAHMDGAPKNLDLDPLTEVVMGGEADHERHHKRPFDPRHSKYDPGYALIWLLEKAGIAEVPARKLGLLDKK